MAVSSERITRALKLAGKMDVCDAGRAVLLDLLVDSLSLQQTQALRLLGQAGGDWIPPGRVRNEMAWQPNHTSNILKRLCELGLVERRRAVVGYEYRARLDNDTLLACPGGVVETSSTENLIYRNLAGG